MSLRYERNALKGIPRNQSERAKIRIIWLWENRHDVRHHPRRANPRGYFKKRIGSYRIVYTYDQDLDEMVIKRVGRRDEIYGSLRIPD